MIRRAESQLRLHGLGVIVSRRETLAASLVQIPFPQNGDGFTGSSFGMANLATCRNGLGRRRRDRCWHCCHSGATH